jgi:hypothetical protein
VIQTPIWVPPDFPKELGPSGNFERQTKNQGKIIVPSLSSLVKLFGMSFTIGRNKQEGPKILSTMIAAFNITACLHAEC